MSILSCTASDLTISSCLNTSHTAINCRNLRVPHRSGSRRTRDEHHVPLIHEATAERRNQKVKIQTICCFKIKSCRLPSRSNALQILDPWKVVLNRPVHLRGNERQEPNVGTEPPVKLATNSMLATTHRLSTMRRVGNRAWKPGNTLPCKSRKPQADKQRGLVATLRPTPGSVQSIDATLDSIVYKAFKPLSNDKFVQQRLIGQVMQFFDPSVVPP